VSLRLAAKTPRTPRETPLRRERVLRSSSFSVSRLELTGNLEPRGASGARVSPSCRSVAWRSLGVLGVLALLTRAPVKFAPARGTHKARAVQTREGKKRSLPVLNGVSLGVLGVLAVNLALLCLNAPTVRASPPFELVGSALGSGGMSARASGADASSTYFNPARLSRAANGLQLGWFVLNDGIDVTLYARAPGNDVPAAALNEFEGRFPSLPTTWIENGCDPAQGGRCVSKLAARPRQAAGSSGNTTVYQVVGLVQRVIDRWLTLGVYGMVPFDAFMQGRTFFADEREQYFSNSLHPERYADRLTAMAMAFAASSQLFDWLSVGVGVTLSLTNSADAGTYVGNSAMIPETLLLNTKIEVSTGVAPNFGIVVTPLAGLDLSLTVHTPQKLEIVTGFATFLPNGDLQRAERTATLAWEPWMLALGAQYDFVRSTLHRMGVVVSATDQVWSQYRDRQNARPQQGYEWSNILHLTGGLRYVYAERLSSYIDAVYAPSPVPLQTGRTNYVDNDRYAIAAGVNYQFNIPDTKCAVRLGLQGQLHLLPERVQKKLDPTSPQFAGERYSQLVQDEWLDGASNSRGEVYEESFGLQTNNPGWPGFSSKGMILGAGLSASLLY
jgi:long-chain fatty acid transport protein